MQNVNSINQSIRPATLYTREQVWKVIRSPSGRLAVTNAPDLDRPVLYRSTSRDECFAWQESESNRDDAWRAFWRTLWIMAVIVIGATLILEATPAEAADTTINWQAPTQNVDGSPLTDLDGFLVYYGSGSRSYSGNVSIADPAATRATVTFTADWLVPGDNEIYIAMTALDRAGNESGYSNEISRTVTVVDDVAPGAPILITITIEIGIDCPAGVTCTVGAP